MLCWKGSATLNPRSPVAKPKRMGGASGGKGLCAVMRSGVTSGKLAGFCMGNCSTGWPGIGKPGGVGRGTRGAGVVVGAGVGGVCSWRMANCTSFSVWERYTSGTNLPGCSAATGTAPGKMPGGGVGADAAGRAGGATPGRACGANGAGGAGASGSESGRISVLWWPKEAVAGGLGSRQPEQATLLRLCGGGVRVVVVKAGVDSAKGVRKKNESERILWDSKERHRYSLVATGPA